MRNHPAQIQNLTWNQLCIYGNFTSYQEFEHLAGFSISRQKYNQLKGLFTKLKQKYLVEGAVPEKFENLFRSSLKGSKKFRQIMDYQKNDEKFYNSLNQIKTFMKCVDINSIPIEISKFNLSSWNIFALPNRFKVFLLKYYNNTLGTGNRVAHIDRTKDPSCNFCRKSGNLPAPLESFAHVFYDCPTVEKLFETFKGKFIRPDITRTTYFSGAISDEQKANFPLIMILNCFRYCIWEQKLQGLNPSYYTIENEIVNLLEIVVGSSKKLKEAISNCPFLYFEGNGNRRDGRDDGRP